jgi:hypothetical protein
VILSLAMAMGRMVSGNDADWLIAMLVVQPPGLPHERSTVVAFAVSAGRCPDGRR